MLKFDKFDVEFDSNRNVFFAGQVVSGRILCHVSEPVNIRGKIYMSTIIIHRSF